MNTIARCAIVAVFELMVAICFVSVSSAVTCLLIGSMAYMEAFKLDIKSIFVAHIDPLAREEDTALLVTEYIKKAVELHQRVNRYILLRTP